jgi:hypothetical protein
MSAMALDYQKILKAYMKRVYSEDGFMYLPYYTTPEALGLTKEELTELLRLRDIVVEEEIPQPPSSD